MTKSAIHARVADAIETAIMRSYELRPLRGGHITERETKHRFEICEQICHVLRHDFGRSVSYICDHMLDLLIEMIDTRSMEPGERDSWTTK